jgi:hypothetical protein
VANLQQLNFRAVVFGSRGSKFATRRDQEVANLLFHSYADLFVERDGAGSGSELSQGRNPDFSQITLHWSGILTHERLAKAHYASAVACLVI